MDIDIRSFVKYYNWSMVGYIQNYFLKSRSSFLLCLCLYIKSE